VLDKKVLWEKVTKPKTQVFWIQMPVHTVLAQKEFGFMVMSNALTAKPTLFPVAMGSKTAGFDKDQQK